VETETLTCPTCGDEHRPEATRRAMITLQTARDRDQTASDQDQTASDQDQTAADRDQTASDRDQSSADGDQEAADEDLTSGGDPISHQRSRLARERSRHDRTVVAQVRDKTADERLHTAAQRDRAAEQRDSHAATRDAAAQRRALLDEQGVSRDDLLLRAERDRAMAAADRLRAAADREQAAADREQAAADREQAARDLQFATTDQLTGAWVRGFGLTEVESEIVRAHRTGGQLVLAFVDVDQLKRVNDSEGHGAGDTLLRLAGETLRARVRPYDIVVRYGGDEFVCALPNVRRAQAQQRFDSIAAAFTAATGGRSISFGLAELEPGDDLQRLVERADRELYASRRSRDTPA
jgi:diguanylate cyclase (GGDEF)-like protein